MKAALCGVQNDVERFFFPLQQLQQSTKCRNITYISMTEK